MLGASEKVFDITLNVFGDIVFFVRDLVEGQYFVCGGRGRRVRPCRVLCLRCYGRSSLNLTPDERALRCMRSCSY